MGENFVVWDEKSIFVGSQVHVWPAPGSHLKACLFKCVVLKFSLWSKVKLVMKSNISFLWGKKFVVTLLVSWIGGIPSHENISLYMVLYTPDLHGTQISLSHVIYCRHMVSVSCGMLLITHSGNVTSRGWKLIWKTPPRPPQHQVAGDTVCLGLQWVANGYLHCQARLICLINRPNDLRFCLWQDRQTS